MAKIKFLGHSCFTIATGNTNLIIDPFLTGNPMAGAKASEIKADYILVTHGHGDHFGDTIEIAKNNDATVIGPNEIAVFCKGKGLKAHNMHIGGAWNFPFGKVKLTIAHHGFSSGESGLDIGGNPCGFVFTLEGKNIYHAGDTGLFMDMQIIGEVGLDLAMLPIGDNFTMGIDDAVRAVDFLKPKKVVPMHYNTFDLVKADPQEFKSKVKGAECVVMAVGDSMEV
ncbi:MAG: metal-dependent hydrolase [Candidatus Zixiibacteriota bacterium]